MGSAPAPGMPSAMARKACLADGLPGGLSRLTAPEHARSTVDEQVATAAALPRPVEVQACTQQQFVPPVLNDREPLARPPCRKTKRERRLAAARRPGDASSSMMRDRARTTSGRCIRASEVKLGQSVNAGGKLVAIKITARSIQDRLPCLGTQRAGRQATPPSVSGRSGPCRTRLASFRLILQSATASRRTPSISVPLAPGISRPPCPESSAAR